MTTAPAVEQRLEDMEAILELTKAMTVEKDLDRLLQLIIAETTRILDADRSSLFIVDRETDELYSRIAQGADVKEIRFPIGAGIAGSVAGTGETVNIPDAYEDDRFNPEFDKKTGYRTRAILCMPLLNHKDETVGVVQVLNKNDGGPFSDYDEQLLASLASQVALTLESQILMDAYVDHQRTQEALEIAKQIQMSLLPEAAPDIDGWDIAGWSDACDETGGDYYDFFELDDGNLGIVVGDVSGHGVGAALLMATARAALRAQVGSITDPSEVLWNMNNLLEHDMEDERFMTLFYGLVDVNKGELLYSSGGHDAPFTYRPSTGAFEDLDSTGMPVGMLAEMDFPNADPVPIEVGDVLVFGTDGIWEAMNPEKEEFTRERVADLVRDNHELGARELIDHIVRAVLEFCGKEPRRDDLTLMVLKRTGGGGEDG